MKKLVGFLVALVIILGTLLAITYSKLNEEIVKGKKETIKTTTVEKKKTVASDKTYHFKDVEKMEKAASVQEAFERIFGKNRLFDDYKANDVYDAKIKYVLNGVYDTKEIPDDQWGKYFPGKQYLFNSIGIAIKMKPGVDTRMEMIDFLHYLKFSGLTQPHTFETTLPEDSVKVFTISPNLPEKLPTFNINMNVFQPIKPGMNTPVPHQKWSISSDVIEKIDFSNKEDILNQITMYGNFEGVNPSGMKE
ncbi:hypothetical protein CN514_04150 [Bacillus sp. AFS001701]|uniref:hypothetical protein n=1 Tax=Bacillus sp. AFS001701 TaxID=2033480 RepID=UPI000BF48B63|nr:hypothetical protein [Bacillus sp. AFS001701]PET75430.1 hypothetical protein CN514_04150 [Bacillus sp. AFS001701]